jgi:hypothetical protein
MIVKPGNQENGRRKELAVSVQVRNGSIGRLHACDKSGPPSPLGLTLFSPLDVELGR